MTWAAWLGLSTAWLREGAPEVLLSESGGADSANDFEAVCTRLQSDQRTMSSTHGASDLNWIETHCNMQRRLYDSQFALPRTPAALEQRHQEFMPLDQTTAHQGLLQAQRLPPIPREGLGDATGRLYSQDERTRTFVQAVFPRTTHQDGCVTLPSSHVYVEEGLPHTRVLLWV